MIKTKLFFSTIGLLLAYACSRVPETLNFWEAPDAIGQHFNIVVTTSAGESEEQIWNPGAKKFEARGSFTLPIPWNLGVLPSSIQKIESSQVILLGKRISPGQVVVSIPIGLAHFQDEKTEPGALVVAIPHDSLLQIISPPDFTSFQIDYDPVKFWIEKWLRHGTPGAPKELMKWENEMAARHWLQKQAGR